MEDAGDFDPEQDTGTLPEDRPLAHSQGGNAYLSKAWMLVSRWWARRSRHQLQSPWIAGINLCICELVEFSTIDACFSSTAVQYIYTVSASATNQMGDLVTLPAPAKNPHTSRNAQHLSVISFTILPLIPM